MRYSRVNAMNTLQHCRHNMNQMLHTLLEKIHMHKKEPFCNHNEAGTIKQRATLVRQASKSAMK